MPKTQSLCSRCGGLGTDWASSAIPSAPLLAYQQICSASRYGSVTHSGRWERSRLSRPRFDVALVLQASRFAMRSEMSRFLVMATCCLAV
jgi:hypothetical protein